MPRAVEIDGAAGTAICWPAAFFGMFTFRIDGMTRMLALRIVPFLQCQSSEDLLWQSGMAGVHKWQACIRRTRGAFVCCTSYMLRALRVPCKRGKAALKTKLQRARAHHASRGHEPRYRNLMTKKCRTKLPLHATCNACLGNAFRDHRSPPRWR